MDQQNRPIGVPGGRPGVTGPAGAPDGDAGDTDRLLRGVEEQLDQVDGMGKQDQVAAFDRMHTALADALARTADTGGAPPPGQPGA